MNRCFIIKLPAVLLFVLFSDSYSASAFDRIEFCLPQSEGSAGSPGLSLCQSLAARNATLFDGNKEGGAFTSSSGLLCLYSNDESVKSLNCGGTTERLLGGEVRDLDKNPWIKTRQLFAGTGNLAGKYDFKEFIPNDGTQLEKATQKMKARSAQLDKVRQHLEGKLESYRLSHLVSAIEENLTVSESFEKRVVSEYLPTLDQIQIQRSSLTSSLKSLDVPILNAAPQILRLREIVNNGALPRVQRWKAFREVILLAKDEAQLTAVDLQILLRIKRDFLDRNGILVEEFLQSQNLGALARAISQRVFSPLDQPEGFAIRAHLNHILSELSDSESLETHEKLLGALGLVLGGIHAYDLGDRRVFLNLINDALRIVNSEQTQQQSSLQSHIFEMFTGHKLNGDLSPESFHTIAGMQVLMEIHAGSPLFFRLGQGRLSSPFVKGCILLKNLELAPEVFPIFSSRPDLAIEASVVIWNRFETFSVPIEGVRILKQQIIQALRDFVSTN